MQSLFNSYFELVKTRIINSTSFNSFGEDSIRYDFYYALMKEYGVKPHNIILEQAIPACQFVPKQREITNKQGRNEDKPEFDLRVDATESLKHGIICEFAYFRSPVKGTLDVSGAYGKILNEIHRLALLKNYENNPPIQDYKSFSDYRCLLICVTDSIMLNYGSGKRGRKPTSLILDNFKLNNSFLSQLPRGIVSRIDPKFRLKVESKNIIPQASRIFNVQESTVSRDWGIWIWEVEFSISN